LPPLQDNSTVVVKLNISKRGGGGLLGKPVEEK